MGQRTAIIVQHMNKSNKKYGKDIMETRVFYSQWGIGRILPSQLVSILNGLVSVDVRWSSLKNLKPQGCLDITDEYDKSDMALFCELNFDNPEDIGNVLELADNNNGGIFLRIVTDEEGKRESLEYAYMLGYEEGGDYKHFCSEETWFKKVGKGYIDDDFRNIYNSVIKYHNAVQRYRGELKTKRAAK